MKNRLFILFILAVIIMSSNIITAIGTEIIDVGSATLATGLTMILQVNFANAVDLTEIYLDIN